MFGHTCQFTVYLCKSFVMTLRLVILAPLNCKIGRSFYEVAKWTTEKRGLTGANIKKSKNPA